MSESRQIDIVHWTASPYALLATPPKADDVPDAFHETACVMVLLHNIIVRGMNTIYHYAPILSSSSVSQRDKADFVNYALAWHEFLHGHHEGEEKYYFPAMESQAGAPGFMASNVAQHKAFQPGLAEFHDYLTSTSAPTRTGDRLREIIDSFAPDLVLHLHDEIPTILALGRAHPNVDIAAIDEVHAKHMLDTVDKFRFIPFMVSNLDHGFEDGKWRHWPPKPPVVVGWLVKWVFPFVYRGAWRFSSCEELKLRDEPMKF